MTHTIRRALVGALGAAGLASASPAAAQPAGPPPALPTPAAGWNDSLTLALVRRAAERRQAQLADTALHDYKAVARGFLTFLGQVGEGLNEPPRVVQAAQVVTEVYWRAPNYSKQRVVGTRDTTVLPTDNDFYRDRYQIVQNNFPDLIRVGEGRDVADVPHPLAPAGPALYDFAIRDSLRIRLGDRTLSVVEVQVRPRDPSRPRIVGSLFVDRGDAQVVRMAFTFTHASYLDKRNEDVSIVLENALVQGRFWLPRRQEVEVRRTGTFLDFPARGIIRGWWNIGEYDVNTSLPPQLFAGPELEFASPELRRKYAFPGRVLDSLPADVRMVSDEDVRRVQTQARALVQAQVLRRARGSALSARAISDFARVNRVEGLALGAGWIARLGEGVSVQAQGRYGLDDREAKGRVGLGWQRASGAGVRLDGYRDFREAGDEREVSLARNSLAAQEFGSDYTDPYDARGAALTLALPMASFVRPTLEIAYEWQRALAVHARPFSGRYEPTPPADGLRTARATLTLDRPTTPGPFGTELQLRFAGSLAMTNLGCEQGVIVVTPGQPQSPPPTYGGADVCAPVARAAVTAHAERAFGDRRLVSHTIVAGTAGEHVPLQEMVYFGGPVTAPGYGFHELVGRRGASQRVELRFPVPGPSISLGRYGRSPATATLAPYVHAAWVDGAARTVATPEVLGTAPLARAVSRGDGVYPSIGVGAYTFFDLVRFDVARGVRDGRWFFGVDVTREFWRVL